MHEQKPKKTMSIDSSQEGGQNAFNFKDYQLNEVLQEGHKENERDRRKVARKKQKFFNEALWIRIVDENGKVIKNCEWKIPRKKFNMKILTDLIKRSPKPDVEVSYFDDDEGVAVWPEELQLKGKPVPAFYNIITSIQRVPFDIHLDPKYEGQTAFLIRYVPLKAKDEKTQVESRTLREWLMFAIQEEDLRAKKIRKKIEGANETIEKIENQIKQVSKMEFRTENGDLMSLEKAEAERDYIYKVFSEERVVAEKYLENRQHDLQKHYEMLKQKLEMEFLMEEIDQNTETASWFVTFKGLEPSYCDELEDLLIAKIDWAGINLACPSLNPLLPPWAGRTPVPDGHADFLPDYRQLQVQVGGARFFRVPHGVGAIKALDRNSSHISSDRFHLFYGDWESGKKTGHGIEFTDMGVFSGRFIDGFRSGPGRMDYADGTSVSGVYGVVDEIFHEKNSVYFDNPYLEGEEDGEVEVLFGDGGLYRGEMKGGVITGKGKYQSAFGEIMMGEFENGMLHGGGLGGGSTHEGGKSMDTTSTNNNNNNLAYFKNHAGEEFEGHFQHGDVHGWGRYRSPRGDTYEGYFDHGFRHGRGDVKLKNRGRYRGYFVNDVKCGKGELEFGRMKKKKNNNNNSNHPHPTPTPTPTPHSTSSPSSSESQTMKEGERKGKGEGETESRKKRESEEGDKKSNTSSSSSSTKKTTTKTTGYDDEELEKAREVELEGIEFRFAYQGFFMSDSIGNGGILLDMINDLPTIVARRDTRTLIPITALLKKEQQYMQSLRRKLEKFSEMEGWMRKEISRKKQRMFRQQKHFTKKTMYMEDQYGNLNKKELQSRLDFRKERLNNLSEEAVIRKTAQVPRLEFNETTPIHHLQDKFSFIEPSRDGGEVKKVRKLMIKTAISDFEEAQERVRYLKFDRIFKRAEAAFIKKKGGVVNEEISTKK